MAKGKGFKGNSTRHGLNAKGISNQKVFGYTANERIQRKFNGYIKRQKQLEVVKNKITKLEVKIEKLEVKKKKLWYESWVDTLLKPIEKELLKKLGDGWQLGGIFGPFGMDNVTSIHFVRKGIKEEDRYNKGNIISITFKPVDLSKGEIMVVDETAPKSERRTFHGGEGLEGKLIPLKKDADWLYNIMLKNEGMK